MSLLNGVLFWIIVFNYLVHLLESRTFSLERPNHYIGILNEQLEEKSLRKVQGALQSVGLVSSQWTPFRKVLLPGSAKCNDGSQAGLYYRLSQNSRRWIVFLEGGWYCFDKQSCSSRWKNSKHFMSSLDWPETKTIGGILSSDPTENPHWWRSNHVYLPYCSSDCWSGKKDTNSSNYKENIDFYFMGSFIIEEAMRKLQQFGLRNGHALILAGSSAGGLGVILNIDRVKEQLHGLGLDKVDVRGIIDSAWFLDNAPFMPIRCGPGKLCSEIHAIRKAVKVWQARIDPSCPFLNERESWQCFLAYKILPYIQAPIFVFQWIFDEAQMLMDKVGKPISKEQWNYIHNTGEKVKKSLEKVVAVFAPSCISHTALTSPYWRTVQVRDITLPDALNCWSKVRNPGQKNLDEDGTTFNLPLFNHEIYIDLQEDKNSALKKNTTLLSNSASNNVVANMALNATTTTQSPIPLKVRHRRKRKKCRQCHKKRQRKKKKKKRRRRKEDRYVGSAMQSDAPNSTLIKSESLFFKISDKHTIPKNKKKKNNKRRKKERRRKKKLRKRRRKKKRRKMMEGQLNSPSSQDRLSRRTISIFEKDDTDFRHLNRKKRVKKNNKEEVYFGVNIKTNKIEHGRCQLQLIDRCSWPHCNPTCPPLVNPYSGEEMSRVQLLKSFGLDMGDFAEALGIDLATLKAMDNKDIVHILAP